MNVFVLSEFARGKVEVAVGRNGLQDRTVLRDAIAHLPTNTVRLLSKRKPRKMGPAKVLEFPCAF